MQSAYELKSKTLGHYVLELLEEYRIEKSPNTVESLESKARRIIKRFGKRQIASIVQSDIRRFKVKMHKEGLKNKTINEHYTLLRAVFRCAMEDGVITVNPMEGIKNLPV
ncbi:site-specific integrase [Pseudomonadota bacterium]